MNSLAASGAVAFLCASLLTCLQIPGASHSRSNPTQSTSRLDELAGEWRVDATATRGCWGSVPEDAVTFSQQLAISDGKLLLRSVGKPDRIAVETWARDQALGGRFVVKDDGTSDSLTVTEDLVLIGVGDHALLHCHLSSPDGLELRIVMKRVPRSPSVARAIGEDDVGYWTKIDSVNDEVVELANGAIVEVTSGYLGYVGTGKRALLHQSNGRLWIEGKRQYVVKPLRTATAGARVSVIEKTIRSAAGDGSLFVFDDGTIFEPFIPTFVGAFSELQTCYVVDESMLLFNDGELIDGGMLR